MLIKLDIWADCKWNDICYLRQYIVPKYFNEVYAVSIKYLCT